MDWHLAQKYSVAPVKSKDQHQFLRKRLQFPKVAYYLATAINTLLRASWILKCVTFGREGMEGLDAFLIVAEMFRRWVWVFFRLEREWFVVNTELNIFSGSPRSSTSDALDKPLII